MSIRRTFVVVLVIAATAAGCATGTGRVAGVSDAPDGQASGRTEGGAFPRCDGGVYNRAAGQCVTGGP